MVLQVVSSGEKVELIVSDDLSLRFRIWDRFCFEHEKWVKRTGGYKGRHSYTEHMQNEISKYLEGGCEFTDQWSAPIDFEDLTDVKPRTIYNFLNKQEGDLKNVHPKTFMFVEAYLAALDGGNSSQFNRGSLLETLGATTPMQYTSPELGDPDPFDDLGSNHANLFLYDASTSSVPGPLQADCILIWLKRIENEKFLYVQIVPMPRDLEFSRFRVENLDRSDWGEEHYSGIAVSTKNGISCHMTGRNSNIPLYLFIKLGNISEINTSFISYESPGYLIEYVKCTVLDDNYIKYYFENETWIV